MIIWQLGFSLRYPQFYSSPLVHGSPLDVAEAGYQLLSHSEIYGHVWLSLLEILGGTVLGGSMGLIAFTILSRIAGTFRRVLFFVLPLTYISPIVLWIFSWLIVAQWFQPAPHFLNFWHKGIAVGFLTFFAFTQTLWGLRDRPQPYRILLAIDDALPIAFVAMLFGELYGSTAGIGFMMTVASATYEIGKGLVGLMITVILLATLSFSVRSVARRLTFSGESAKSLPA